MWAARCVRCSGSFPILFHRMPTSVTSSIPYLVCVDAATARTRSLTRTVFSEEQKIIHSLNDAPQSTIYVFFIISDIFCRCTCRARAGTLTIFLLCVALLSGCYFACVSSSYHPVSGLRRCCHRTGAQSHESGIFEGTKNHPSLKCSPVNHMSCLL